MDGRHMKLKGNTEVHGRQCGIGPTRRMNRRDARWPSSSIVPSSMARSPLVASLLLVAMPAAPNSFLFLVVRPGAPSSDARSPC